MAKGLKPGDKVVMVGCAEASLEKYKDKVWEVDSEPWDLCGSEVVLLRGFRGGFATKCLKRVEERPMSKLPEAPTAGQVKDFLLSVMDYADDRTSKVNPSFTKEQIWNVFMGSVISKEDDAPYMKNTGAMAMAVKNINREFGGTINE